MNFGTVLSVNLAVPRATRAKEHGVTGIDKRPTQKPVDVRAPGPKHGGLGSGLVGDQIFDVRHHGGDEQAVYAYAREDLDWWSEQLGVDLPGGCFGENLTTRGLDVTEARIGERWKIGDDLVLQVTVPRIPCGTFKNWMAEQQYAQGRWIKSFTQAARPGAYLSVVSPGTVRAGDRIEIVHRPEHDVTIGLTFRAITLEPDLLPLLLTAEETADDIRETAERRIAPYPGEPEFEPEPTSSPA
ncbi:MOSC domain-containing protein [Hamadaea tsunoensis]|uniref:MOSC domain-containing protein n=1 Tax=Hamadaea tsunoensis TaxID=53368 RepID=UPI000683DE52|nr:MOSC domain-containing protein [Hamadaea tsunoensis]